MFRVVSSAPYSAPVDRLGVVEWTRSKVCGHEVEYHELGVGGMPGGYVHRFRERCAACGVERIVQEGKGKQAALFVTYCEKLGMRPFDFKPDDFTEHEFWLVWVSSGRAAAVADALQAGYRLSTGH